ncbi:MAG: lipid-A-disaccharide synthase [bacterium]
MQDTMTPSVMIVAGEVSGDLHGASLAAALRQLDPGVNIFGTGGVRMRQAGVDLISETTHLSSVGLIEAFRFLPTLSKLYTKLGKIIEERRPKAIVLIDNQGFNLQLAKLARKKSIPTLYYFAPQIWLWGSWKAKKIAHLITHVIATLKTEEAAYKQVGAKVSFVGHPFVDTVRATLPPEEASRSLGLDPLKPVVGLLPGSRYQEVKNHLPILMEVVKIMLKQREEVQFVLPIADPVYREKIISQALGWPVTIIENKLDSPQPPFSSPPSLPVKIIGAKIYDALSICDLLITSSGIATMEATCLGIPMIIIYRTSYLTYFLARSLLKLPYVGMPNIIAQRQILPELLQREANPEKISILALDLLSNQHQREKMREDLASVVGTLGQPGAVKRAAQIVHSYL